MIVYISIALFLFSGVIAKQKRLIYQIGTIVLFLLTAFRNPILGGSDYYVYSSYFETVPSLLNWSDMSESYFEIGYRFLNATIKLFSSDYLVFQIVYALLVTLLLHEVISLLSLSDGEKCLFLFSFFCFHYIWDVWIILRQNIADLLFWILIILLYRCPQEQKKKRFVMAALAVVIPALFHDSGAANVVLLPVMLFLGKIDSKKKLIVIPIVSLFLYLFGDRIYQFAVNLAVTYLRASYSNYTQTESSFINYCVRLCFFCIFAWHFPNEKHPQKELILDSLTMMVLIGSFNDIVTTRLYEYYAIGLYGCMALFIRNFSRRSKILASGIFGVAMLVIMVRFLATFDNGALANYSLFYESGH